MHLFVYVRLRVFWQMLLRVRVRANAYECVCLELVPDFLGGLSYCNDAFITLFSNICVYSSIMNCQRTLPECETARPCACVCGAESIQQQCSCEYLSDLRLKSLESNKSGPDLI